MLPIDSGLRFPQDAEGLSLPLFVTYLKETYGDLVTFYDGTEKICLISRPDHVRTVLQTRQSHFSKKGMEYQLLQSITGEGLSVANGERWRRQRALVQPAFHKRVLAEQAPLMGTETGEMLTRWATFAPDQVTDIGRELACLTLKIVSRALFGYAIDDFERVDSDWLFGHILNYTVSNLERDSVPWLPPLSETARTHYFSEMDRLERIVEGFVDGRRRQQSEQPSDLLALLLTHDGDSSDNSPVMQTVYDQIRTFLITGSDTISLALLWTLLLLDENPAVAAQLQDELDSQLEGNTPTLADLASLPYLRMVIAESMRIYPAAWSLGRRVEKDILLGDTLLTAGMQIWVCPFITHRDPQLWDDPLRFNPQRFAPTEPAVPANVYYPFGLGARNCIGRHFAMLEIPLVLVMILQRFRLRLAQDEPVSFAANITLRPAGGMWMKLQPR